ncbi:MAG: hypothetical protein KatS3mg093_105 [Candidatus Parcubacteria bacterium]|nr:MAG: hypothetical protein KatS3mg093_105 [Candidatus Parcubacteria bacterium]
MKRIYLLLIIVSLFLMFGKFVLAIIDLAVPVTDSQLKAVNSVLDTIQTVLTEKLKNIDLNIYNLLRIQYESFFIQNYQDKILKINEIKNQIEDLDTLLTVLSSPDRQGNQLDKFKRNAELAGAYQTLIDLPSVISCIPGDYRELAEDYLVSLFSYYDLANFARIQLSFIPDCDDIQPNFGFEVSVNQPSRSTGFLGNALANIFSIFSLTKNMLAVDPSSPSFVLQPITITSGYRDSFNDLAIYSFYQAVTNALNANVVSKSSNLPDPRNVYGPSRQVFTDSGQPITLSFQTLIYFEDIYEQRKKIDDLFNNFTVNDIILSLSTSTFSSSTAQEWCKNITISSGQGGEVDPRIACVRTLGNFLVNMQKSIQVQASSTKEIIVALTNQLKSISSSTQQAKASTTPECEGARKRLEEIEEMTNDHLQHIATATIDVDELISRLTNNRVQINNTINRVSSTVAYINTKYKDIVNNINKTLEILKLRGISGGIFKGLPLDFIDKITQPLKGVNALLILKSSR